MDNYNSIPVEKLIERFKRLYSGVVSDAIDKVGFRYQLLPHHLRPLRDDMVVIGPAFTGYGKPIHGKATQEQIDNDHRLRFDMLESIKKYNVSVWSVGGAENCAQWGGMMTRSTMQRGAIGTIIDGGIRDVNEILDQGMPIFHKFFSSGSSIGRWTIVEFQKPIIIGTVTINPGDFIFGDIDGVLCIPKDHVLDVLDQAEELFDREQKMSSDMIDGMEIRKAYDKYGVI